jgi:hypothetical protein
MCESKPWRIKNSMQGLTGRIWIGGIESELNLFLQKPLHKMLCDFNYSEHLLLSAGFIMPRAMVIVKSLI